MPRILKENGKPAVKAEVANQKEGEQKPKKGCLKCGDTGHRVAKCPKVAPGEAEALLEAQIKKWKDDIKALKSQSSRQPTERGAIVEGKVRVDNVLLDTAGLKADVITVESPRLVYPYGNDAKPLAMTRRVKFNSLTLDTTCGPLVLRGFQAWIDDASPLVELIVSRPVMEILGFSVDDLLVGARKEKAEWDVSADAKVEPTAMLNLKRLMAESAVAQSQVDDPDDGMECATPEVERPIPTEDEEARREKKQEIVRDILLAKADEAKSHGLEPADAERLEFVLLKHIDVFLEPLKVRIKPGSTPVKCSMRRYPPLHVEYMREHVAALEACGMVYLNNRATWAAAPRIVPKKEAGALRMTIDSRPINA
ncbi:hypothetical protein LEN26_001688 [Aphanomyces euteiches]|nr:hypothetical protein AeMF1_017364 [Aphanomyces euteiches]KAH9160861.1 hypothetical protein LEN26_001688 [Aphanomyces euteiches]